MRTKHTELLGRLSEEEQQSLRKLCRCCCKGQDIPGDHAEKFLIIGLAEMTCGGLGPTSYGRHVAAVLPIKHGKAA
jgi:hypothetical protein